MSTISRFAGLLLLSSALVSPTLASAQDDAPRPQDAAPAAGSEGEEPRVDISIPGGGNEILVTGRRDRNVVRASDQVVSILSSEEIARTGEGDTDGAVGHVTAPGVGCSSWS